MVERDKYKDEEVLKKTAIFKFFTHRQTENNAVNKIITDEETEFIKLVNDFEIKTIVIGADNPKMKQAYDKVSALINRISKDVSVIYGDMDLPRS